MTNETETNVGVCNTVCTQYGIGKVLANRYFLQRHQCTVLHLSIGIKVCILLFSLNYEQNDYFRVIHNTYYQ